MYTNHRNCKYNYDIMNIKEKRSTEDLYLRSSSMTERLDEYNGVKNKVIEIGEVGL